MKKFLAFVLVLILTLTMFAGCGSTESAELTYDEESGTVNWPTDSLIIYSGAAAGANMDIKARLVASYLGDELGVPVVIENISGASGITVMTQYLTVEPNANTILHFAGSYLGVLPIYNEVEFTADDYVAVSGYDVVENGFFVSASLGISTIEELIEYGQDKTIKFAAGGAGNDTYLVSVYTLESMGLDYAMVTGSGFAEGLVNCSTGVVDVMYCALNQAEAYVDEGTVIPIGVYMDEAYDGYSDVGYASVPTMTSLGIDAVYSTISYFGMRAGTDEAVIEILNDALQAVYSNPDFLAELEAAGFAMMDDTSTESIQVEMARIQADMEEFADAVGE